MLTIFVYCSFRELDGHKPLQYQEHLAKLDKSIEDLAENETD
ncbi:hypothetical protein [Bacillus sp. UNC41MFS5]|nr:hypothetical protein [Bacillus sp. UNC41MFS5]